MITIFQGFLQVFFIAGWKFDSKTFMANELLFLYYMTGITLFVTPLPLFCILCGLDSYSYIIMDIFMPHPYYHDFIMVIWTTILSYILLSFLVYILFKQMGIVLAFVNAFGIVFNSVLSTLEKSNLSTPQQLKVYSSLQICFKICGKLTDQIMATLFIWGLSICSILPWIAIKCIGIVPLFIVIGAVAATIGGVLIAVANLQMFTSIRQKSLEFIASGRASVFTFNRSKSWYYYLTKWRAQQVINMTCGGLFPISKHAIMVYLDVLSTNITNSVLLIHP